MLKRDWPLFCNIKPALAQIPCWCPCLCQRRPSSLVSRRRGRRSVNLVCNVPGFMLQAFGFHVILFLNCSVGGLQRNFDVPCSACDNQTMLHF